GVGCGFYGVGDLGEDLVGVLLLSADALECAGGSVLTEEFGPAAQSAVDGNLVVLDLLGGGDQGDVADAGFGGIFDVVLRFRDKRGNGFACAGAVVTGGVAKEVLHLGDVTLGLGEVIAEGAGEL